MSLTKIENNQEYIDKFIKDLEESNPLLDSILANRILKILDLIEDNPNYPYDWEDEIPRDYFSYNDLWIKEK